MRYSPKLAVLLLSALLSNSGCLALTIGGKTVTPSVDVESRVSALEARVDALEHQTYGSATVLSPATSLPGLPTLPSR
jgi:hypothetical protein